ncbi:hypothetical protein [Mesomycoplasma dispar]|uniref:ATP synthase F1 complex delta/epsilon subunit N-terminal domain-containing protein n=1 Tax=Mesomycoplasma dispar TaxID=86660 RepID=A0ABM6PQF1_9BACT|nr:hypothetical protein [Mesomycoplasma dispar]ATP59400.1 hypothetical protein CSW10_00225 [Mesomycoplasma dispar]
MKKINFKIFTPNGVFHESKPDSVLIKTKLGYRVAQYGITPFVGVIDPSILQIFDEKEKLEFEIKSGIVFANKFEILIFTEDKLGSA